MKELSSPFTFFYKFIFLLIWIIGFGLGTKDVLLAGSTDPRWLQYMVVWIAFAVFIFFSTGNVKKVRLKRKTIEVSNFFKTIEIDRTLIDSVDGSTYLSPRLVWFNLKDSSQFGKKIIFIPAIRKARGIGKHPLVHELAKELNL